MKAEDCPYCEQPMELQSGRWWCTTESCAEKQLDAMLLSIKLGAALRQSKRLVEQTRAEVAARRREQGRGGKL